MAQISPKLDQNWLSKSLRHYNLQQGPNRKVGGIELLPPVAPLKFPMAWQKPNGHTWSHCHSPSADQYQHTHTHRYIYIYIFTYVYISTHIYIYISIHIYIYIYIYIYHSISYHITALYSTETTAATGRHETRTPIVFPPSCTAQVAQRLPKWFATTLRFSSGKASLTSDSTTGCAPDDLFSC